MESKTVLEQIWEWAVNQPLWLQETLRRIVRDEIMDEKDIEELVTLLKKECISSDEIQVDLSPISETEFAINNNKTDSVSLISLGSLENVNRIPTDQTITFGNNPGLTVIYGENGTGKTGYARVLKKVCRSRGTEPVILPNIFDKSGNAPAKAKIVFSTMNNNEKIVNWISNVEVNSELSNIFVFDSHTSEHYISFDDDVTFTPFGLDILPRLVKVYDDVSNKINDEIKFLQKEIENNRNNWNYPNNNKIAEVLNNINHVTEEDLIKDLALLYKEKIERINTIKEILKSDPLKKSVETKAASQRIQKFINEVDCLKIKIDDLSLSELRSKLQSVLNTAKLAKEFSEKTFNNYLKGTGSPEWKLMWEAAKKYSEKYAYIGKEYPFLDESLCVLCQQDLRNGAVERMKEFEKFVRDKTQQEAEEARENWSLFVSEIKTLADLNSRYDDIKADISSIEVHEKNSIENFIKQSKERLEQIKKICVEEVWNDNITSLPEFPKKVLVNLVSMLNKRAATEESANDPEERTKLENEKIELETREWLQKNINSVLNQISRYKYLEDLKNCKPKSSRFITDKNSEITKIIVSEVFCESFKSELESLQLKTLKVKLEEIGGVKGHTKFGLRLIGAENSKVYEIASEGEQRCIALAAFLAELSQASHKSALVFDDPSSSLDHRYRENIANRLVQESKIRQVVIFTHDATFLNDLQAFAEGSSLYPKLYFLEWSNNNPGFVREGLPWDCKSPEDRIDKLEKMTNELKKNWSLIPSQTDIEKINHAYSFLRATIERIVEKVVFNNVVFRFRTYINMKNLKNVVGFNETECSEIDRLYNRCCDFTDAHDKAQGKHITTPTPDLLKKDIEDMVVILKKIKERIKLNQKN